jgi:hypothetical protein
MPNLKVLSKPIFESQFSLGIFGYAKYGKIDGSTTSIDFQCLPYKTYNNTRQTKVT